jgi:hypothetical protein
MQPRGSRGRRRPPDGAYSTTEAAAAGWPRFRGAGRPHAPVSNSRTRPSLPASANWSRAGLKAQNAAAARQFPCSGMACCEAHAPDASPALLLSACPPGSSILPRRHTQRGRGPGVARCTGAFPEATCALPFLAPSRRAAVRNRAQADASGDAAATERAGSD